MSVVLHCTCKLDSQQRFLICKHSDNLRWFFRVCLVVVFGLQYFQLFKPKRIQSSLKILNSEEGRSNIFRASDPVAKTKWLTFKAFRFQNYLTFHQWKLKIIATHVFKSSCRMIECTYKKLRKLNGLGDSDTHVLIWRYMSLNISPDCVAIAGDTSVTRIFCWRRRP